MEPEENYERNLEKARKRVQSIKEFYRHLQIFIVLNMILLFLKFRAIDYFEEYDFFDENFINWFEWNIVGIHVLWGIGLGLHAIYVFVFEAKPLKELGATSRKE